MLDKILLQNILFLDIETVPEVYEYSKLPASTKELWDKKMQHYRKENEKDEEVYKRAGIYAEFAKVVCISVGVIDKTKTKNSFRIKSFYGDDEKQILKDFITLINTHYYKKNALLCAHNGKEFDFPFMARRMLINGLKLPAALDLAGKKPWEVNHLDTLELWKFGDYKNFTSLNLLASVFKIPTPKDDIDGSQVARVYWEENNLKRIVKYCQKDVLTVAQLLLRFKGETLINDEDIVIAEE